MKVKALACELCPSLYPSAELKFEFIFQPLVGLLEFSKASGSVWFKLLATLNSSGGRWQH